MNFWNTPQLSLKSLLRRKHPKLRQIRHYKSPVLGRDVDIDIWLPPHYDRKSPYGYPVLICNDGQDLYPMNLEQTLADLYKKGKIPEIIVVGIHANEERIREYGTSDWPDFKNRGDKAGLYRDFLIGELLPFVRSKFRVKTEAKDTVFAGFSLGGLSAFDLSWRYPEIFGICGVFSGALWWRFEPFNQFEPDKGRIAHERVFKGRSWDGAQRFWFQCGELDETSDRNNNGVIDSIDDTLDLIRFLKMKGHPDKTIRYLEIEGGRHDQPTWGKAMPDFLCWAFQKGYGDSELMR